MSNKSKKGGSARAPQTARHRRSGVIPVSGPISEIRKLRAHVDGQLPSVGETDHDAERLRAECALLRARYRELCDSLPAGHLTLNVQGTIVEANLAAATLLGREREELIGLKL